MVRRRHPTSRHNLADGIQRIVTAASRAALTTTETLLLTGAITVVMLAMTAIGATSAGGQRRGSSSVTRNLMLAAATLTIGIVGQLESPVVLINTIAALCIAQFAVSLARASQPAPRAQAAVQQN
jgi:hypothetical protein